MGNTFSTDKVTVKIKPYFYILDKDGYSQTKIKNFKIDFKDAPYADI